MSHRTNAQIKSITPRSSRAGHYKFRVELIVDGRTESVPHEIEAEMMLDFQQSRVAVARQTGYLLSGRAEEWDVVLSQVWQAPEPQPEGWDDLTCNDNSPLSQAEIDSAPKELRDIYKMPDRPCGPPPRWHAAD